MHRAVGLLVIASSVYPQSVSKEFEVAAIKRTPPREKRPPGALEGCRGGPGTNDPELLTCEDMSIFSLALMAYQIERVEYYRLVAPDWTRQLPGFDLKARSPAQATADDLAAMLRSLLADRFGLRVHRESREVQEYDLMMGKSAPKFNETREKEADGNAKRDDSERPTAGADGYPVLPAGFRAAVIDNRARLHDPKMSMTALAAILSTQLGKPVHDRTGLSGNYDIDLRWDTAIRSDSDPGPTLVQAVEELGLRLEPKKGVRDFVVVDHVEKAPSAN